MIEIYILIKIVVAVSLAILMSKDDFGGGFFKNDTETIIGILLASIPIFAIVDLARDITRFF